MSERSGPPRPNSTPDDRLLTCDHSTALADRNRRRLLVRRGREKLHYLNAVPINDIAERWIGQYDQERVHALADLKLALEGKPVNSPEFVYPAPTAFPTSGSLQPPTPRPGNCTWPSAPRTTVISSLQLLTC